MPSGRVLSILLSSLRKDALFAYIGGKRMDELEENIYEEIKKELIQSSIDKKVDIYFTNHNELTHYYNVGKMIVDAQGGEERAK